MAHLTLAGLSEDGRRLLLVDDRGTEHTLTVDSTLRTVLRGGHVSLGQLEIHMDSALRPRDIQARIRAGETPEGVAQAAQTTVDRIMVFAGPVLAERAHVADRAQRASLRRPAGEAARTLGQAVGRHLTELNVPEDQVEWDAWRREDGRWTLTCEFSLPGRSGTATFSFDVPGNFVVAEDDDAAWLVGLPVEPPASSTQRPARRRLAAVVDADELPLGEDAIEMVSDPSTEPVPEGAGPAPTPAEPGAGHGEDRLPAEPEQPELPSPFLDSAFRRQNTGEPTQEPEPVDGASPVDSEPVHRASDATDPDAAEPDAEEPTARRTVSKKRGRASVPSWDEIMFGGSDQD